MQLRPYQQKAKNNARASFQKGNKAIILQAPTGSGKTVTFSDIASAVISRGRRVIIVVDRKELLDQSVNKLRSYGLYPEIITGGRKNINYFKPCYVATVQTLKRRQYPDADLVVIDEAHKQIFDETALKYKEKGAKVIGATATPIRKGSKMTQLSDIYDDLVIGSEIIDLIKGGFLVPARTFGKKVDVEGVKIKKGDYDPKALFDIYDKPFLYTGLTDKYKEYTPNTKAICFNINIEHSINTRDAFRRAGISAEHVDGNTPKAERERLLAEFARGSFAVLCNVDILTTGYDEPTVETVIVNRRTKSVPLWLQMCGRGSRPNPGKTHFNVLDMGGNTAELGFWEKERKFSLSHKIGSSGVSPVKNCPEPKIVEFNGGFKLIPWINLTLEDRKKYGCGAIVHAGARYCPECNYIFPKKKREKIEAQFTELNNIEGLPPHLRKDFKQMTFDELHQVQQIKGYNKNWILHQFPNTEENLLKFANFMDYSSGWVYQRLTYLQQNQLTNQ